MRGLQTEILVRQYVRDLLLEGRERRRCSARNRGAARLLRKAGFEARGASGIYAEYELSICPQEPIDRSRTEADLKAA